jgi:hypothetical protein
MKDQSVGILPPEVAAELRGNNPAANASEAQIQVKCSQCDASVEIAEAYRRSGNFLCRNCRDLRPERFPTGNTENAFFDSWGRVKDQ